MDPGLQPRVHAEDSPEVYGDAWLLVAQWRELKARLPVQGRSLSWLTGYEWLLALELAMMEEQGLTLPPQKQSVKGLDAGSTPEGVEGAIPNPSGDPAAQAAALAAPVAHFGGVVGIGPLSRAGASASPGAAGDG